MDKKGSENRKTLLTCPLQVERLMSIDNDLCCAPGVEVDVLDEGASGTFVSVQ